MPNCKYCGKKSKSKRGVKTHARSAHDMKSKAYGELDKLIPDAAMDVWITNGRLRNAFPVPGDMEAKFRTFENFVDWIQTSGAEMYPEIAEELAE